VALLFLLVLSLMCVIKRVVDCVVYVWVRRCWCVGLLVGACVFGFLSVCLVVDVAVGLLLLVLVVVVAAVVAVCDVGVDSVVGVVVVCGADVVVCCWGVVV